MAAALTTQILILILILCYYSSSSLAANPSFNVLSFGAKPDGKSDCTQAFLRAWGAACATTAPATILVPKGRYLLRKTQFQGHTCRNKAIRMQIDGTLVAPFDYNFVGKSENWVTFERVTGVSIIGGNLDARGAALWACKRSGKSCPDGATSIAFYHSDNINIKGLTSLNSQKFHILLYQCRNAHLINVKVIASGESPNTDGIHVQLSSGVTIMNSLVGTGDDCVSIGPGTSNLRIENLVCGPGHGISIGSLGWEMNEPGVQNVTVKGATFTRTQNGVRIKTWARPSNGFVRDVHFQDITMVDVENPVIIDQHYCPSNKGCPTQESGVKISNVMFKDIRGTATKQAVKIDCSKAKPCTGVKLDQVRVADKRKPATAS